MVGAIILFVKMKKSELQNRSDIWNAMVFLMSDYDFPTDDHFANKTFLAYHYYSELESGGHEALFNWSEMYFNKVGVNNFFKGLIAILKEINAHDYASIEEKYGETLWGLYKALENDDSKEEAFYNLIEKADQEYYQLDGKLERLLEEYFIRIYTQFIEVVD